MSAKPSPRSARSVSARGLVLALLAALAATACSTAPPEALARALEAYPPSKPFTDSVFVELPLAMLHCRVSEPEGEPIGRILLVHGLAGSTYSWRLQYESLSAAGYRVVAVDVPPFGFSARSDGYPADAAGRARLLWDLLDALGPPGGTWILAGHSLGGRYVAEMALGRPDRAEALVLAAAAVGIPGESPLLPRGVPWYFRVPGVRALARAWVRSRLSDPRRFAAMQAQAYGREPGPDEFLGYWAPLSPPDAPDALVAWAWRGAFGTSPDPRELALPTLLVWGTRDAWVPFANGEALAALVPGARLEAIEGGGHCVVETAGAAVDAVLLPWLAALDQERSRGSSTVNRVPDPSSDEKATRPPR
ncbi:MAG: alpha/beta hydrolase [Spirochaetales bacterium]|nr:alpha/beta hydrolase [Spirochaetales bacterium]